MTTTVSTNTTSQVSPDVFPRSLYYTTVISCVMSSFGCIFLLQLIWMESAGNGQTAVASNKKDSRWRATFTPFNISLAIQGFSLTGLYLADCFLLDTFAGSRQYDIANTLVTIFLSSFEAAYISYSGLRALDLVREIFPSCKRHTKKFTQFVPCILPLQSIPSLIALGWRSSLSFTLFTIVKVCQLAFTAACGVLIIGFDAFLVIVFVKFMNRTVVDDPVDAKFTIIAKHGMAAIGVGITALSLYIISYFWESWLVIGSHVVLGGVFAILLRMKIMLRRDKMRQITMNSNSTKNIRATTNYSQSEKLATKFVESAKE